MKAVNIAELKNNLSSYLKKVQKGEEVVVKHRNVPIAKIVQWTGADQDDLADLAAKGAVRLGSGAIDDSFWTTPGPKVPEQAIKKAIAAERFDG